jgi:hypothetical protein
MTPPRTHRARLFAALGVLFITLLLSGCYNPFSPLIAPVFGFSKPAPVPSSASNLLRLLEWCYNNQTIAEYRELFTDDYRFIFSPLDSSGAEYRGTPWTREDELIYATHLFVGGSADRPPASHIRLDLDKNFFVYPDPDFSQTDPRGRWHKNIRTQVLFNIQTDDGSLIEISGAAQFYMVRGDSALIPEELRLRGFDPDSNRWYIRRWDDETAQPETGALAAGPAGGPLRSAWRKVDTARPAGPMASAMVGVRDLPPLALSDAPLTTSWGYLKAYYRRLGGAATLGAGPGTAAR